MVIYHMFGWWILYEDAKNEKLHEHIVFILRRSIGTRSCHVSNSRHNVKVLCEPPKAQVSQNGILKVRLSSYGIHVKQMSLKIDLPHVGTL